MNQKGFTLVELIIYIAITSVVVFAFVTFALRLAQSQVKAQVIGEVEYNAQLIQARLSDAVRHAEAINTGTSVFNSDPGTISFDMADATADPTIFSLTADDGSFQVNVAGAGETTITTDGVAITNLVFEDLTSSEDVGVVRVQFTVTAVNNSNDPLYDYEQSFQTTLRIPLDAE